MRKETFKKLRKYNFIILFGISFFLYICSMGVQVLSQNLKENDNVSLQPEQSKPQETLPEDTSSESSNEPEVSKPDLEKPPQPDVPDRPVGKFTTADRSYLDGALFIGDSRTATLSQYAGWDQTSFFVEIGLTIWDVMDAEIASIDGEKKSVRAALGTQVYDKIYIMLGINELGMGSPESFCEQYRAVIDEIRSLQPQAVIYIQSIMHVTQSKDDQNYYINNDEINRRNERIQELADWKNIFWLDVNQVFDAPGTGKLNPEYTSDGIHLKPIYIDIWQAFLLSHVIL